MKTHLILFAAGLLALAPLSAQARIERTVERSFDVQPGGRLTVDTSGGNVRVNSAPGNTVKVTAKQRIKADSESEADDVLKDLELVIEKEGDGVLARSKYTKRSWGSQPVHVDFTVTVPARYNVNLRTSGGNVEVGDLDGVADVRTSGGDIALGKISGNVDANTSGGSVSLAEGGGGVKLGTSGGNIRCGRAAGGADLDTSGGNIDIKGVTGSLKANTSGGDVRAEIHGPLTADCELSTSGGQVRAVVDANTGFQLDASTSGGGVRAEGLTITIDKGGAGRSRLSGKVNGGGPRLKMHSSGGDIVIETR